MHRDLADGLFRVQVCDVPHCQLCDHVGTVSEYYSWRFRDHDVDSGNVDVRDCGFAREGRYEEGNDRCFPLPLARYEVWSHRVEGMAGER